MKRVSILMVSGAFALLPFAAAGQADEAKATALMKKEGCVKCHSVSADKGGPSLKSIAAKYKGNAEGEKKVIEQMTKAEKHPHAKTKDQAELQNLAKYILSR